MRTPEHRFLIGYNHGKTCLESRAVDSNLTLTNKFFLPKEIDDKKGKYIEVVCSCRGLVVLKVSYTTHDDIDDQEDLVVWNPSTNNYMVLPPVHFPDSKERGCDYGFGYDKSTNDFKLVMFAYVFEDEGHSKMYYQHVYSVKLNSWGTPLVVNTGYMNHFSNSPSIVDDHIIHWLFWDMPNNSKVELRGFDICTEEWLKTGSLPFPPDLVAGDRYEEPRLGVLNNCLCLSNYDHRHRQSHVWVMKEYGVKESWTKLFSLSDGGSDNVTMDIISPPIAYYEGQLLIELRGASDKFFWYNLKDKTLKPTGDRNCLTRTLCTDRFVSIPLSDPTKEQVTGNFDRESI